MKHLMLAQAITVAALSFAAQSAFAIDGTINFTGEINDAPCSISPASSNMTVNLGKVNRTTLNGGAGRRSTPADFTIDLLNCGATANGATVSFAGTADGDNAGLLRVGVGDVTGGAATGVGILLTDSAGTPINPGAASAVYPLAAGNNKLKFRAAYQSTRAETTVGPANAIAQFTVTYR